MLVSDLGKRPLSVPLLNHSGPSKALTLKISKMNQICVFISGWVGRITYNAQFCPIPSPSYSDFIKKRFCILIYYREMVKSFKSDYMKKM